MQTFFLEKITNTNYDVINIATINILCYVLYCYEIDVVKISK